MAASIVADFLQAESVQLTSDRIDLSTDDDLKYTFYPVSNGCVSFKVRANNDAHIAFTSGPEASNPMTEVFLGGWKNTKSIIRRNQEKPDKVEVETPDILNGGEFRGFWIRWDGGAISVGKEGEGDAFMSWEDPEPFGIGHFGVCTGWGASGTWIIEGRPELNTDDSLQYKFHPVISGQLEFEFKGPSNCHVALTKDSAETDPMYEIILGGWENKKSVIRHRREKPDKVTVETENIVHHGEFRKFLVQWTAGRILVRSGSDGSVIMEWVDEDPFPITHFGMRTAWGATGKWKIINRTGACGRVAPSMAPSAPEVCDIGASCWVDVQGGEIPPGATVGGQDGGEDMYIARAVHEGALIPGKAMRSHGVCYIAWGGQEHGKPEYQVMVGGSNNWVPTSGGNIPQTAIPGGESEEGEPLYIGRVQHEGSLTIGKVQGSHGVCYISYGGEELGFNDYEVLVA